MPLTRRLTFANLVTIDVAAALLLAGVLAGAARTPRRVPLHLGVPVGVGVGVGGGADACTSNAPMSLPSPPGGLGIPGKTTGRVKPR